MYEIELPEGLQYEHHKLLHVVHGIVIPSRDDLQLTHLRQHLQKATQLLRLLFNAYSQYLRFTIVVLDHISVAILH